MRANIISIDGNNANCGQFSMVDGVLYNGTFKIGFDEQQLLDLSALLSWWRYCKFEPEVTDDGEDGTTGEVWFKYPEWPIKDSGTSAPSTDAHSTAGVPKIIRSATKGCDE